MKQWDMMTVQAITFEALDCARHMPECCTLLLFVVQAAAPRKATFLHLLTMGACVPMLLNMQELLTTSGCKLWITTASLLWTRSLMWTGIWSMLQRQCITPGFRQVWW